MRLNAGAMMCMALAAGTAKAETGIEFWQHFHEDRVLAMEQLIRNFEAANPDIKVSMHHFPKEDYRSNLEAAIPAGEGPDVAQIHYGWLDDYVAADLIQPLPTSAFPPETVEEEFFPLVAAMRGDNEYWALPTAVGGLGVFYNKRLFEEAGIEGPPETLDEMVELAKKLTKRDDSGNLTQVGLTVAMSSQDHHWFREVLVRQFGGEPYLDDYRTVNYNSQAGVDAAEFYMSLVNEHKVTAFGFLDAPVAAFKAGKAGMYMCTSHRIRELAATDGLEFGATELPTNANGLKSNYSSYWANAVTANAAGAGYEAAVKFIQYVTSDEAMQIWLDMVGELPAKPSVGLNEKNSADPVVGPFIRGLTYAHATKFADEAAQRQVMIDMVRRMDLEGQSVADSVARAAQEEQALLDEHFN